LGIEPKGPQDTLPFHPYYTTKDIFGLAVFLIVFSLFVFYAPNMLGHPDNYIEGNPMVTPAHIVPEWYFLPFYAILRAITFNIGIPFTDIVIIEAKLGGVIAMFGSIAILFVLPWLDTSPVRSADFRPIYKKLMWVFLVVMFLLGAAGAHAPDDPVTLFGLHTPMTWVMVAQLCTLYYFAHFLVALPLLGKYEKTLPLPYSISESVLKGAKA
jgi:quinol-cytochrome oxidoreductase complex cytochrome b subunit